MIVNIPQKVLQLMKKPAENNKVIHFEQGEDAKIFVKENLNNKTDALVFSSISDKKFLTVGAHTKGNTIPVNNILNNREHVCDGIMERMLQHSEVNLYVMLDVLDPAFVDVQQEHGGLTVRELLYFLQRLAKLKNLNTVNIEYKQGEERIAAKLALEVASTIR